MVGTVPGVEPFKLGGYKARSYVLLINFLARNKSGRNVRPYPIQINSRLGDATFFFMDSVSCGGFLNFTVGSIKIINFSGYGIKIGPTDIFLESTVVLMLTVSWNINCAPLAIDMEAPTSCGQLLCRQEISSRTLLSIGDSRTSKGS